LLRDSDLKLEAIAMESGFGSAAQLCRFFARAYGSSPNVWRERMKGNPGSP
jgi:transcriptional regulator GlxA family with amidase domain